MIFDHKPVAVYKSCSFQLPENPPISIKKINNNRVLKMLIIPLGKNVIIIRLICEMSLIHRYI